MVVYVAVRTPSAGSLVGGLVQRHPGSRVTSVPVGHLRDGRIDHLALVEGVPKTDVAELLLAWNLRYGVPAEVLGDPFALRLPVILPGAPPPWDTVLAACDAFTVAGAVVEGGRLEQWLAFRDRAEAQTALSRLRQAVGGHGQAEVFEGEPRGRDLECWDILHEAVALEWPAAAGAGPTAWPPQTAA